MFQNNFADFKNPIVLHNVIFNMNATSKLMDLNTSVIIDRESPTKILLRIEESVYT